MAEVIWTETALQTLDEIADYIALDNYEAACRLVQKVFDKVDLLEESPTIGTITRELRGTPYRRLVIKPVYVYYRTEGKKVVIVFVDRNERDFMLSRFTR